MTFEEMQRILEQMLAVQRELQESQISQRQDITQLLEAQQRQERLLDRLIGYSITSESNHLDLEERLNALERRMRRLEGDDN